MNLDWKISSWKSNTKRIVTFFNNVDIKYLFWRVSFEIYWLSVRCGYSDVMCAVTQQIVVNVVDGNDNPPVFVSPSYTVTIREKMPVGASVVAVTATDVDVSSLLTFSVTGSQSQYFFADSIFCARTGVVRMKQAWTFAHLLRFKTLTRDDYRDYLGLLVWTRLRLRLTEIDLVSW